MHESEFRVGVPLLFGVEIPVYLSQPVEGRFGGHRCESAGTDMLDPHHIGHELFQAGPLFVGDQLGTGRVPVDVGQRPLAVFDRLQHIAVFERHVALPFFGVVVFVKRQRVIRWTNPIARVKVAGMVLLSCHRSLASSWGRT